MFKIFIRVSRRATRRSHNSSYAQHHQRVGNIILILMGFDVSSAAANAVLYSILTFFTILAIISGGYLNSVLPPRVVSCCLLRRRVRNDGDDDDDTPTTEKGEADHFLSARNSASAREIALSFFASGMGAWVRSSLCPKICMCHSFR